MVGSNRAVNALRGFGSFHNASLRLLDDVVDTVSEDVHPQSLRSFVIKAMESSFSLYWSLNLNHWPTYLRQGPALHKIWLCERPGMNAPLEALAHVLARSIAREHKEPAAVATVLGDKVAIIAWDPGGQVRLKGESANAEESSIQKRLGVENEDGEGKRPFCHLIVVRPANGAIPEMLRARFHRIVAVTDDPEVRNLPPLIGNLRDVLLNSVFKNEAAHLPHYGALIPTIIVAPYRTGAAAETSEASRRWRAATALYPGGRFEAETIASGVDAPRPKEHWRLSRDMCRLGLDLDILRKQPDVTSSNELDEVGKRWARAVTNRQVGLALSGGGACCYRLVPLINEILKHVPIDVVGGVSGGALLGAYFCALGPDGIEKAIKEGPNINWYGLAAMVDSRALQFKIDYDLDAARIEELPIRFVAITTAVHDDRRPEGQAVVCGTVGEAVRMSGSAPIQFGRTVRGTTRYADGATTVMIPARALRDYGADIVFACNAIPGPATGNPFSGLESVAWKPLEWATSLLIRHTELGRFIDAWIATAFLIEQGSREVEEDASEYAEATAVPAPLSDGIRFWAARELASTPPVPTSPPPPGVKGANVGTKGPPAAPNAGSVVALNGGSAAGCFIARWGSASQSPRLREAEEKAAEKAAEEAHKRGTAQVSQRPSRPNARKPRRRAKT